MEAAGLEAAPSILVKPPRVSASPCALECKWLQTVQLIDIDGNPARRFIVFGQVVGIHIDERFVKDGFARHRRNETDRAGRLPGLLRHDRRRPILPSLCPESR